MRRPRRLTAGEARLWGEVAKLITPLPGRAPDPEAPQPTRQVPSRQASSRQESARPVPPPTATMPDLAAPVLKPSAPPTPKRARPKAPKPAAEPPRPPSAAPYQAPPQRHAPSEGLDRKAKVGLRRGRLAVEARIDLHGMVQAQAHAALTGFLLRARAAGHAYVLVVTGKGGSGLGEPGMGGAGRSEAFAERGVLRRSVPHWLRGPDLRGIVAGFEEAARHHGGAGALYVRLRRG